MDFFEHQEIARRNTRRLVLLMSLAVVTLILLTTLLVVVTSVTVNPLSTQAGTSYWQGLVDRVGWQTLGWVALLITTMVLAGCLFKWFQLRSGGQAVAEALGGQLIPANTDDPAQRRVLNVVEEMAIASGTPVPPVYRLEEEGINAFAAGHGPHDAVIGVTDGCINRLTRDELQGVIAHEFSHILHGDMRLNLRLVAVLNGILLIGLIGRMFLYGGGHHGYRRRRDRGNTALIGLGLVVLGAVGTFFGNWIKAAVSRQREFLADASAVQYTRNPLGISGALMKIGGASAGSRLKASDADEFSHMYFEEGVHHSFSRMMATHPPLEDRIKRVLPSWDGTFPDTDASAPTQPGETDSQVSGFAAQGTPAAEDRTSAPKPADPATARTLLDGLPSSLREACREPFGARGVILGLALSPDDSSHPGQWQGLEQTLTAAERQSLTAIIKSASELDESLRLPALELALPTLRQLSAAQRQAFLKTLDRLIHADGRVQLREWIVYRLASTHLAATPSRPRRLKREYCRRELELVLALTALAGNRTEARAAFAAGAEALGQPLQWPDGERLSFTHMDRALDRLRQLRPLDKPPVLKALRRCLWHDQRITPVEAELYRALADALDCPTPPLTAG